MLDHQWNELPDKRSRTSFATSVLARNGRDRSKDSGRTVVYDDTVRLAPPTSNKCEQLFSSSKLILTPQRTSLLPVNFEMIAFLQVNRTYWDVNTVASACANKED